jgi:small subunit ribosomal protein S20
LANTKSAIKRWRQSLKRRLRNRVAIGSTRTSIRVARESIAGNGADPAEAVRLAASRLDSAAQKGAIHRNAAARKKSRLMRALNARVATEQQAATATPEAVMAEAKPARSRSRKPAAPAKAPAATSEAPAKPARSRAKKAEAAE